MEQLYNYLPRELVTFILVTLFSLLIGLSQRRISLKREGETTLFGTDCTFTFIGILGYLLYILDPADMRLFIVPFRFSHHRLLFCVKRVGYRQKSLYRSVRNATGSRIRICYRFQ